MSDLEHRLFNALDELRGCSNLLYETRSNEEVLIDLLYQARGTIHKAIILLHERERAMIDEFNRAKTRLKEQ